MEHFEKVITLAIIGVVVIGLLLPLCIEIWSDVLRNLDFRRRFKRKFKRTQDEGDLDNENYR